MALPALVTAARSAVTLAQSPSVRAKAAEYFKAATGEAIDFTNTAQVNSIINKGPAPAAVLLKGLVSAGVNPDDIFEKVVLQGQSDAATRKIIADLQATYANISAVENSRATIKATNDLGNLLFRKEVVQFAARAYGSPQAIREAHAKLRAFLDMDTAALEETLALHHGR